MNDLQIPCKEMCGKIISKYAHMLIICRVLEAPCKLLYFSIEFLQGLPPLQEGGRERERQRECKREREREEE